jgi:hypothetical protein
LGEGLFSIRPVEVKHNQSVCYRPSGNAARGSALLLYSAG